MMQPIKTLFSLLTDILINGIYDYFFFPIQKFIHSQNSDKVILFHFTTKIDFMFIVTHIQIE